MRALLRPTPMAWFGALLLAVLATAPSDGALPAPPDNTACFRCHAMETLTRRTAAGGLERLTVSPAAFAHSEHGKLSCTKCHAASFAEFPHPAAPKKHCLDCHKDKPELAAMFADIGASFRKSVHAQRHPDAFDCFRCHDPHQFARWRDVSRRSIAERNGVCLACHAEPASDVRGNIGARMADKDTAGLERAHAYLPHARLHMRQVRCLDCHTSGSTVADAHAIMPKGQAVHDCVQCHSANTVLRDKLYRYERTQETARRGFLNAAVVNDAYVIGATRNRALDAAGLLMVGLTGVGAAGHSALRRRALRQPEDRTESEDRP